MLNANFPDTKYVALYSRTRCGMCLYTLPR